MKGPMFNLTSGWRRRIINLMLVGLLTFCSSAMVWAAENDYSIAVLPSLPPVAMHTQWVPVLQQLTLATGKQYSLRVFERMAEFENALGEGQADFIFASPIQTVVAHQMHGYIPLVRGGNLVAVGLFVRKDSDIQTMEALSGKPISFVGNKNLCSVFVQHLMNADADILTFKSEYAGSTSNVIKNVILGKTVAGAVFIPAFERQPEENRQQLRKLFETPKIPPHPFSAHPRVPQILQEEVRNALLKMADTPDGNALLKQLHLGEPVAADYKKDFSFLELIDIRGLTDWGR